MIPRRLTSPLLLLCLAAFASGGCGADPAPRAERAGRVLIVGIDGAAPALVDRLIAEDKLPHLASLARDGAAGTIRSLSPIDSPRIWNTVATGKPPAAHGITHFATKGPDGENRLLLSTDRKVHALWNIVSDAGHRVGVVNFWNTYPPERIDGVMVSDHVIARNIEGRQRISKAGDAPLGPVIHPPGWHDRLSALLREPSRLTPFDNPLRDNPDLPRYLVLVGDDLPRRFDEDTALARIALEIEREIAPRLLMVLLPGVDRASHFLWGSLQDDQTIYDEQLRVGEREKAGGRAALETVYRHADALVGLLMEGFGDEDLVLVLSDHGFEPGRGMGLLTGVHEGEASIDGIAFARGPGIAPGSTIAGFRVADVTPTVLAWMGLPVGADMEGRVASFLDAGEVATVPSHDTRPIERMALRPSGAEDEIVEQLRELGYVE